MKKLFIVALCTLSTFALKAVTLNLDLHCLIQGYYSSAGQMTPAAFNQGCPWAVPGLTDRVLIQLRKKNAPYAIVGVAIVNLPTSGHVLCNISHPLLTNGSYYIVVKNARNALETWSSQAVSFVSGVYSVYDFTTSASKAYGNNQILVDNYYCFYSGDVNQNGCINTIDTDLIGVDIANFVFGCFATDINGDVNVDLLDVPIVQANLGKCVMHP